MRYEDLVKDPFDTIQMLYDFSGIELNKNVLKYLRQKTHGSRKVSILLNNTERYKL